MPYDIHKSPFSFMPFVKSTFYTKSITYYGMQKRTFSIICFWQKVIFHHILSKHYVLRTLCFTKKKAIDYFSIMKMTFSITSFIYVSRKSTFSILSFLKKHIPLFPKNEIVIRNTPSHYFRFGCKIFSSRVASLGTWIIWLLIWNLKNKKILFPFILFIIQ